VSQSTTKIEEVKKDINHTAPNRKGKREAYEVLILYFDHQLSSQKYKNEKSKE
jgi:hypothetical protein